MSLCAGRPTVNTKFSTRTAVLVGDFLFAQSSYFLAHLDNSEVRACGSLQAQQRRIVASGALAARPWTCC